MTDVTRDLETTISIDELSRLRERVETYNDQLEEILILQELVLSLKEKNKELQTKLIEKGDTNV